jgi:hypothetical protein
VTATLLSCAATVPEEATSGTIHKVATIAENLLYQPTQVLFHRVTENRAKLCGHTSRYLTAVPNVPSGSSRMGRDCGFSVAVVKLSFCLGSQALYCASGCVETFS